MGFVDMANRVTISRVNHLGLLNELELVVDLNKLATLFVRYRIFIIHISTTDQVNLCGLSELHVIMIVRQIWLIGPLTNRLWLITLPGIYKWTFSDVTGQSI